MTFARHRAPLFAAASVIAIVTSSVAMAADFRLENVVLTPANKGATVTIKTIDVKGTNLTQDEFKKFYDPATSKEEIAALAKRAKFDSITVPEIVLSRTDDKPGTVTFRGYQLSNYNAGKFARFTLAGVDGKFRPDAGGGDAEIKVGPLTIEGADLSTAIDAAIKGDIADAAPRFGKFELLGLEVKFPEKAASGPLMHTFKMASLLGTSTYSGEIPLKGFAELKNAVFIPAPNSDAAKSMAQFGYNQVDIGLKGEGTYNPANKSYDLSNLTINGVNAGAISFAGLFGSIGPEAFNGSQMARLGALMQGELSAISLRYADSGLFDKALVFYAKMNGKDPVAVRQEWAGMIAGILPMMTGGDPGAMKIASAVSEFIKAPKSLTISIKSKGGPVKFAELGAIKDPAEILKRVDIEASANK
jgi:hypothetical protein